MAADSKAGSTVSLASVEKEMERYNVIIQRLMKRLGVMRVVLTDKDDPADAETLLIEFYAKKKPMELVITRVPETSGAKH